MKLLFEEGDTKLYFSMLENEMLEITIESKDGILSTKLGEKDMLALLKGLNLIIYHED